MANNNTKEQRGAYVVGVGAANVDVHGRSRRPIVMRDSNPGHMNTSAGGVTRNVCENLARLGADARLITAVGDDVYGEKIIRDSVAAGVDVSAVYRTAAHASSTYISILDERGDMLVALSDMSVLELLPSSHLSANSALINGAQLVTCDPSLPPDTMRLLLDIAEVPVYVDPVSTSYARTVKDFIGRFDTAKPNRMEAEILSGVSIDSDATLAKAADALLARGLKRVFISLGGDGCYYADRGGLCMKRALRPLKLMRNATGAGDAFMAALIFSTLRGYDAAQTLDFAAAASIAAVSADTTINPEISEQLVNKILKEHRQ